MPKPASEPQTSSPDARPPVRVWDLFVRVFHWSLVLTFAVAWLTRHSSDDLHHLAGYAAGALVLLRVVWGVIGTHYARFRQFVRGPQTTVGYLRAIVTGHEARYLGHNPAGGLMIVALLAAMAGTATTGWMMTTDAFWGVGWVGRLHELMAQGTLALVLLHLLGVVIASRRHHENLVGAMLSGLKRAPGPTDVE